MSTKTQHIAIPPSESSSKKIKVFLPNIKDLNDFLKKSNRFEKFGITTFEDIIKYLKHFYKIEIVPLYIDEDSINKDDLERHDYIAILPISDDRLRDELSMFVEKGIPIILVREDSKMDCEVIKLDKKENECYRVRSYKTENLTHCDFKFYEKLKFDSPHTLIRKIKESFKKTKSIPIFSIAYIIDFFIWYAIYGRVLREKRDFFIEQRTKTTTEIIRAASQTAAQKSN